MLGFLETWRIETGDPSGPTSFGDCDLQVGEPGRRPHLSRRIAAILERRPAIERSLRAVAPDASLVGTVSSVPWLPLRRLFDAFADIRGVGFSKTTKALHRKRPALIPMLDSVVQEYLKDDDLEPDPVRRAPSRWSAATNATSTATG